MSDRPPGGDPAPPDTRAVVADAIQNLTAARLGRGFVPLAILFGAGGVGLLRSTGAGVWTAVGAIVASAAMLAYGLRTVQRALGRAHRPWMSLAMLASVVPPAYALYVLAWRGLRGFALGTGVEEIVSAILFVILGVWVLRAWMGVVEIERLAQVMSVNLDGDGESA